MFLKLKKKKIENEKKKIDEDASRIKKDNMLSRKTPRSNTNVFASARVFRNVNVINRTFNPFSSDYYCIYGLMPLRTDDEQPVRAQTKRHNCLVCFFLRITSFLIN